MISEYSKIRVNGILEEILEQHASDRGIEMAQLKGKELKVKFFRYAKEYYPSVIQEDMEFKINKTYCHGVSKINMYKILLPQARSLRTDGYDVVFFFTSHND